MIKALKAPKPPHDARREITCWMKLMGYTDETISHFFGRINWQDYKYEKTIEQVISIHARIPDCGYLSSAYGDENCKNCPLGRLRNGTVSYNSNG